MQNTIKFFYHNRWLTMLTNGLTALDTFYNLTILYLALICSPSADCPQNIRYLYDGVFLVFAVCKVVVILVNTVKVLKQIWLVAEYLVLRQRYPKAIYSLAGDAIVYFPEYTGSLDEVAEWVRQQKYETAAYFNYQTHTLCSLQTIHRKGSCALLLPDDEANNWILLHNHDNSSSFSLDDLVNHSQLSIAVVVSKYFDYIVTPRKQWVDELQMKTFRLLARPHLRQSYKHLCQTADLCPAETEVEWESHHLMCACANMFDYAYQRFPAGELSVSAEIAAVEQLKSLDSQQQRQW